MKCKYGDRVRLVRLGENCEFEGVSGTVIGCSYDDPFASAYIVETDSWITQPSGEWGAISITEHCLERIES